MKSSAWLQPCRRPAAAGSKKGTLAQACKLVTTKVRSEAKDGRVLLIIVDWVLVPSTVNPFDMAPVWRAPGRT
jgi:hypothetical protein